MENSLFAASENLETIFLAFLLEVHNKKSKSFVYLIFVCLFLFACDLIQQKLQLQGDFYFPEILFRGDCETFLGKDFTF